jgi:phage shock protein A
MSKTDTELLKRVVTNIRFLHQKLQSLAKSLAETRTEVRTLRERIEKLEKDNGDSR